MRRTGWAWARLRADSALLLGVCCVSTFVTTLFEASAAAAEPASEAGAESAPDGDTLQCLTAYEDGQRKRIRGALQKAKEDFVFCGGAACPAALHADCQRWLKEVEMAMPSSLFRVASAEGQLLSGVTVAIDGGRGQPLSGQALSFEPGGHMVFFTKPGYQPVSHYAIFMEGEQERVHNITMVSVYQKPAVLPPVVNGRAPPGEQDPMRQSSLALSTLPAWIGAGVGLVGTAAFAYFGLSAREDDRALGACSPNCSRAAADSVARQYHTANISLGVGVAGFLGAAGWLLWEPTEEADELAQGSACRLQLGLTGVVGEF